MAERENKPQRWRNDKKRPRNYLSRREQYRLMSLVFTLLLVLFLMVEAAKPENWRWMWQLGQGEVPGSKEPAEDPSIDTRLPREAADSVPADVFLAVNNAEQTGDDASRTRALGDVDLSEIVDDTVFRAAETEAWFGILGALRDSQDAELAKQSVGTVGFTQLFRQTDEYRGQVVTVTGTVRRAFQVPAGTNQLGIDTFWQCWLQPDGSPNPLVVYSLNMPAGFPEGMSMRERVDFDGVLFKRWAYAAKEGTRTAPLILAKSPMWTKTLPTAARELPTRRDLIRIVGLALAVTAVMSWMIYRRTQSQRRTLPDRLTMGALLFVILSGTSLMAQESNQTTDRDQLTPVEFLGKFEIETARLRQIAETVSREEVMAEDIQEITLRSLNAWRRCPVSIITRSSFSLNEPMTDAEVGDAVRLRARLENIERIELTPDLRDRYLSPAIYVATCAYQRGDEAVAAKLIARHIPKRWQTLINDPAGLRTFASQQIICQGLNLSDDDSPQIVLTERIAWHPEALDDSLRVGTDHVLLASHGLDVGQLDEVQAKGPLSVHDRAAFYQLLLAMSRIPSPELTSAAKTVNVTELLQDTDNHLGQLYSVTGTARRCVKVLVEEEQAKEFGVSHYYELVIFLDPDALVKVRSSKTDDGKYFATYPVVVCVRSLPDGFPEGEEVLAAVNVVGSYLKLWAYPSEFMQSDGSRALQFSPLLIGGKPHLVAPPTTTDPLNGPAIAIGFAISLLLLSTLVWWWNRGDEKFKRETLSKKYDLPSETSLDDLGEPGT